MIGCVALLRAVNVGGRNKVPMATLRDIAIEMGLAQPRTLLQSGNLVFGAAAAGLADLPERISAEIGAKLAVNTSVILRTSQDLAQAVLANPFDEAARTDPSRVLVTFLSDAPRKSDVGSLSGLCGAGEAVEARGRELFIHFPDSIARSRLTAAAIDRRLGLTGTARNWNTVTALLSLTKDAAAGF